MPPLSSEKGGKRPPAPAGMNTTFTDSVAAVRPVAFTVTLTVHALGHTQSAGALPHGVAAPVPRARQKEHPGCSR